MKLLFAAVFLLMVGCAFTVIGYRHVVSGFPKIQKPK